ncbi:MAG TPA: ThiF family adenylyltransferase, partial [Chitinophagaceae bacterium]|nr:ThiF family adenylyltransferase [Chitinophagaceae bacterium]
MKEQTVEQTAEKNVPAIYGRYKGADWFDLLYKRDIMILGQGGIGSWLSFLLSRTGAKLYLYDMDRFEDHNGGQLMFRQDVGQLKTAAIAGTIADFSPDCALELFGAYTVDSETAPIVLTGFDRNDARKLAFNKWAHYVSRLPESKRKCCFFQDGRLLAEQFMI